MPPRTEPDGATPGAPQGDGNGPTSPPAQPATGGGDGGQAGNQQQQPSGDPARDALNTDAGKQALAAERQARKDAETRATQAERDLRAATTDQEKAIAEAKAEARREVLDEANARLIRAEVVAAAAGKLANPQLAVKLLDLTAFKVDKDGEVDVKDIEKALDKLLTDEPYLKAKRSPGNADGGQQGEPVNTKPSMDQLLRIAAGHEG